MKTDKYELVVTYIIENQQRFYRLAYSYVRNQEDALDIVQNAICKALENYEALRSTGALRSWFYRILVNESLAFIKRHKREVRCEDDSWLLKENETAAYRTGTGMAFGTHDAGAEVLYQEIGNMPLELQHIIKLHYFEDMTLQEVSEILEINLNTVKARLYRGLKKLKLRMKEDEIWEK